MTDQGITALRGADGLYCGPIVDAHHHLWDLSLGRHDWLAPDKGLSGALARDQFPADYLEACARHNVEATVHVEAGWDPTDPLGEIAWLDALDKPGWLAKRYVATGQLQAPDAIEKLRVLGAHRRVAGIRQIVSWHPDPALSRNPDNDLMDSAAFRRGFAELAPLGLSFDLLATPWQTDAVMRLVSDFDSQPFIVNHCGAPVDRDEDGMTRWRRSLERMAQAPNVAIKISDLVAFDPAPTPDSLRDVVLTCIDCFGPARCMFASDHPVQTLAMSFDETYRAFKRITEGFSDDECLAMFVGNARKCYRLDD